MTTMDWKKAQKNPRGYTEAAPKGPPMPQRPEEPFTARVSAARDFAARMHKSGLPLRPRVWLARPQCRVYLDDAKGRRLGYVNFRNLPPTTWFASWVSDAERSRIAAVLEEKP